MKFQPVRFVPTSINRKPEDSPQQRATSPAKLGPHPAEAARHAEADDNAEEAQSTGRAANFENIEAAREGARSGPSEANCSRGDRRPHQRGANHGLLLVTRGLYAAAMAPLCSKLNAVHRQKASRKMQDAASQTNAKECASSDERQCRMNASKALRGDGTTRQKNNGI